MAASLEIYETTLASTIPNLNDLGSIDAGTTTAIYSCKIRNNGDETATLTKLIARCFTGLYSGQTVAEGQEAVTRQMVEVDAGSGFTPIGGDFGNQGVASNYVSIADIPAGGSTGIIDFRLVLPIDATIAEVRLEIGVDCYQGETILMASDILPGDVLQPAWFLTNSDGKVRKDALDLENTADPLAITQNGQTLLTLGTTTETQGDLKVDGDVENNADLN